jgi:endoglucanase
MKELIRKLVETTAPSGFEAPIRAVVRAEIEPLADEIRTDALGSLIARIGSEGPKVMLSAHIDEIGVIVTHVDDNGYARIHPLGGVNPLTCVGGRVRFVNGAAGVIGVERTEAGKPPVFEQLYVDLGVSRKKDCPVQVGDAAGFERPMLDLGDRLVGKSMDDRIGAAILIETMRVLKQSDQPIPNQAFFVFSVQEEVGLRGATVAAYGVEPDLGIAVDVTGSGDTPRGLRMETALGKGPAIKIRDASLIADPRVVAWMTGAAEAGRIPYQREVLTFGGTDAGAISLSRSGVPSGCVSIACRYIHSPSEMVDTNDVQNAVRLLVELLNKPARI